MTSPDFVIQRSIRKLQYDQQDIDRRVRQRIINQGIPDGLTLGTELQAIGSIVESITGIIDREMKSWAPNSNAYRALKRVRTAVTYKSDKVG